jgi:hypothetical protein
VSGFDQAVLAKLSTSCRTPQQWLHFRDAVGCSSPMMVSVYQRDRAVNSCLAHVPRPMEQALRHCRACGQCGQVDALTLCGKVRVRHYSARMYMIERIPHAAARTCPPQSLLQPVAVHASTFPRCADAVTMVQARNYPIQRTPRRVHTTQRRTPRRWIGSTRDWSPIGTVYLNPIKQEVRVSPIALPMR